MTSIAHTEIRRSGISELYPPVGRSNLLGSEYVGVGVHGSEVGDVDEDDVVEVDERR